MRKNQYEEALFRVEDDRFELDMAIEVNASAIRALLPLVDQVSNSVFLSTLSSALHSNTRHMFCQESST